MYSLFSRQNRMGYFPRAQSARGKLWGAFGPPKLDS